MENKYYTPEVTEIHIGFEFEFETGIEGWKQFTITGHKIEAIIDNMSKFKSQFRVKYLDKDDIESLGWEHKQFVKEDNICLNFKLKDFVLTHWLQSPFENGLWIEVWNDESDHAFSGYIKNKSELSKLMKQLGIND